jgi:Tfp pilus assembly protein PilF
MRSRSLAVLLALAASLLATGCQQTIAKLRARDNLGKGVQAFKNAQFAQAVDHFQIAVDLDPTFPTARLYLATAYMSQWIPGAESPENERLAKAAFDQFQKVLDQDPNDKVAIASIASLYYNQKNWDEAEKWYRRLITVDPNYKEAYYTLGVIAWTRWLVPNREARIKMGMKPEDPGPLKDKKIREELAAQYLPVLDEGLKNTDKALQIDPEYDDAMAYMNLLVRYRADLLETPEAWKKESAVADDWVQKSLNMKKIKAERKPAGGGITTE